MSLQLTVPKELGGPDADKLVETAHGICPYSNAIRSSVDVKTSTRT